MYSNAVTNSSLHDLCYYHSVRLLTQYLATGYPVETLTLYMEYRNCERVCANLLTRTTRNILIATGYPVKTTTLSRIVSCPGGEGTAATFPPGLINSTGYPTKPWDNPIYIYIYIYIYLYILHCVLSRYGSVRRIFVGILHPAYTVCRTYRLFYCRISGKIVIERVFTLYRSTVCCIRCRSVGRRGGTVGIFTAGDPDILQNPGINPPLYRESSNPDCTLCLTLQE